MADEAEKKPFRLHPKHFYQDAAAAIVTSAIKVPEGVPVEALRETEFYAMFANKMTPGQFIRAVAEDRSYIAEVYVRSIVEKGAKVTVLSHHSFDVAPAPSKDYDVRWAGGQHRWRVVRLSDGEVVKFGFAGKEDGWKHVEEITKKIAA